MRRKTKKPEEIKGILNKVIGKIEKQNPGRKEKILGAWQRIVGGKAASHSRPVSIRRKVLTIEMDSSTWLYTLNLKRKSILKDIKKELEEYKIENIRFRIGDIE
ncbi:DciA family protein [Candidatus Omnitrophota bacterium]